MLGRGRGFNAVLSADMRVGEWEWYQSAARAWYWYWMSNILITLYEIMMNVL